MGRTLIELSNKTTEVMANRLVKAFQQQGVQPTVYRVERDGAIHVVTGDDSIPQLQLLSRFYPDYLRPPLKGLVGTKLYRAMLKSWQRCDIDAVLLFDDGGGHKRVIAEWGRAAGVPIVHISESGGAVKGLTPPSYWSVRQRAAMASEQLLFPKAAGAPGVGLIAEHVCAPNPSYRDWLANVGYRPQKIVVTGSPLYDGFVPLPIAPSPSNHQAFFVHQPLITRSERYRQHVLTFFELAERYSDVEFVLKLHPHTSHQEVQLVRSMCESRSAAHRVQVVDEGDSRELVRRAGVAVMAYSTVLNDAVLAGVPVVLLKGVFGGDFDAYLDRYGAAIPVFEPEQLSAALHRALFDADTREELQAAMVNRAIPEYFGGLDGRASERVVSFVLSQIGGL